MKYYKISRIWTVILNNLRQEGDMFQLEKPNLPHRLLLLIYTRLWSWRPSPSLPLPATESALSGSWLFHLLRYYFSKYSTRKDNQVSTFLKNVFINLLTNYYVETKWTISAIKSRLNPLLNIELSSSCFENIIIKMFTLY